MNPLLILVAGGSASGKSTVVSEIVSKAGLEDVLIIRHDDYYKDQSNIPFEKRLDIIMTIQIHLIVTYFNNI